MTTSSDATIIGSGAGGLSAAIALAQADKKVLHCRTRDLLKQNGTSLTFLPSEDVSAWPEYLRRKMERGKVAREEDEMVF